MTPIKMTQNCIDRFSLKWPVEIRIETGQAEWMDTVPGEHTLYLCAETSENYLNELMAAAKLAEVYEEPLLNTYHFENEESFNTAEKKRSETFCLYSLPIRLVWLQRLIKQYMTPKEYKADLDFIEEIYLEWQQIGERVVNPYNFFAYYLILLKEGRQVEAPPHLQHYPHSIWQFSRLSNAEPSTKGLINAYNTLTPSDLPRAELSKNGKIKFAV